MIKNNGDGTISIVRPELWSKEEKNEYNLAYNRGYTDGLAQVFKYNEEIDRLKAENEVLKKKIQNMALDLLSAHAQADDHWVELQRLRKAQEK